MRFEFFFSVQFRKGNSLWLKKLVCGCANAVLAILSYNMRLQVSVSVHFSYQINMCYITPWACIITISLSLIIRLSIQLSNLAVFHLAFRLTLLKYKSCVKPTNEKDFVPRDKKCHPRVTVAQIQLLAKLLTTSLAFSA